MEIGLARQSNRFIKQTMRRGLRARRFLPFTLIAL
jgi:hypothetical protein